MKTDLTWGPPKFSTRYLGWLIDLRKKALKLPADKRKKILDRIDRFIKGRFNVVSGLPKKTAFLFNTSEISSLTGSLCSYATVRNDLVPYMTPFYRLFGAFPKDRRHDKFCFRRLNLNSNTYLLNSLKKIRQAVDENDWIPFTQAARASGTVLGTYFA